MRADDALFGEHGDMGLGARDVLPGEAIVETDGGVDLFHDGVGGAGEPAAPHLIAHDPLQPTAAKPRPKRLNPKNARLAARLAEDPPKATPEQMRRIARKLILPHVIFVPAAMAACVGSSYTG